MNNSQQEENIQQVFKQFTGTWNVHNAQAFSNLFSEEAEFTNVFGQTFHGRDAVEKQHAGVFKTMLKDSCLTITETRIRFLNDDLAATDVIWTMTGATDPKGNPWNDRKGLMSLVLKHESKGWKILIMHNMDLPAASFK